MAYTIRTPAGSDRYSLTSDLRIMADDTIGHLEYLNTEVSTAVKPNTSPTFVSIATSASPTFPGITITGTRPLSLISNDVNGFGLRAGNLRFGSTNSSTWTSSGHISIPNNGTGTQAINRNALDSAVNTLNTTISSLSGTVTSINNGYATKVYVDGKVSPLSTSITSLVGSLSTTNTNVSKKANYYGEVDRVNKANYADSAGSAGWATKSGDSDKLKGRKPAFGKFTAGTVAAGASSSARVYHNLGYIPVVLATAVADTGVVSIVCSVGDVNTNSAVIKYRNLNSKVDEWCQINWLAI